MSVKLSVCIFAFNHAQFIAQTLDSVLTQVTDFDFEIIVGEDCSTDNTREIVKQYEAKYSGKVRGIYRDTNVGLMRNYADTINQTKGQYIATMDADDYWIDNQKLQKQVSFLDANSEYVLCFHDAKILKIGGEWDSVTCCGPTQKKIVSFTDIICDTHIPTSSLVFRRSALVDFPQKWFFSLNAPDRPLFLILTANGPGYYLDECLGVYRRHTGGHWTSQNYQSQWLTHLKIYNVMNRSYNKKYNEQFCECERRVSYEFAMGHLKHKKFRRAVWYLKKYLRGSRQQSPRPGVFANVFSFWWQYLKNKLNVI